MTRQKPYITIQEAARALGKSDKTLRRWIAAGKLASKRVGGRLLVQVEVNRLHDVTELSLEERLAAIEKRLDRLEDALVVRSRQPRPMRKLGNVPR